MRINLNPQTGHQNTVKNNHCPSFLLKQTIQPSAKQLLNIPKKLPSSHLLTPRLNNPRNKSKSQKSNLSQRQKMESTRSQQGSSQSSRKDGWEIKQNKQMDEVDDLVKVKQYENVEGNILKINIRSTLGNSKPIRNQARKMSATIKSYNEKAFLPYIQRTSLSSRGLDSPRSSKCEDYFDKKFVISDFEILEELGKGKTSNVYLSRHKELGMIVVLKKISKSLIKSQNLDEYILREIKIHSYVKHDNIVGFYGSFTDTNSLYMIMQYMSGSQTLHDRLKAKKTLTQKQTKKIVLDVCHGIQYLHNSNIIHRDIKLENLIYSNGVTKITDFGCSVHTFFMRKSQVGSPVYLSPQQVHENFYNQKIDVWSIGIMTFEMLFGYAPFDDKIESILHGNTKFVAFDVKFPFEPQVSQVSKDFIYKLLSKNPNQRLSIQNALSHPFLKDIVSTNYCQRQN